MSRMQRRAAAMVALTAVLAAASGTAVAFWQLQATGGAGGVADVLPTGPTPNAFVSGSTVTVSWTSVASAAGRTVQQYDVRRSTSASGGTAVVPSTGTCSTTVTATSCTDTNVTPGTYYYEVTPRLGAWSGATSARSLAVSVTSGAAAKLAFSTQPSTTATAGSAFAVQPVVQVQDAGGALVSASTATVTLAVSGGNGVSGFTCTSTAVAASSGTAAFAGCRLTKAGTYTLTATSTNLTSAQSTEIKVSPAAADRLVFTSAGVSGTASSAATLGPLTVERQDAYGNAVTGSGSVALTSGSSGARFATSSGGTAVTSVSIAAEASSATFWYGDTKAGTPQVSASLTGLTAATQTQTITAGSAAALAFVSCSLPAGNATCSGQPIAIGNNSSMTAVVEVRDTFGNPARPALATLVTVTGAVGNSTYFGVSPATRTVGTGSTQTEAFTFSTASGNDSTTASFSATAAGLTGATIQVKR